MSVESTPLIVYYLCILQPILDTDVRPGINSTPSPLLTPLHYNYHKFYNRVETVHADHKFVEI